MSDHTIHPTISIAFAGYEIVRLHNGNVRITQDHIFIDDFTAVEFDGIAQRVKAVLWMKRKSFTKVKHVLILALAGAITSDQLRAVESNPDTEIVMCIAGAECTIVVSGLPASQAIAA